METISQLFAGPFGPIVIFLLRIVDVAMATVRILLSVRGHKRIVPLIGFVEVLVWLFAAGNAIRHLESGWHVLGYAAGFAAGSALGLWLEEKLALGYGTIRIISRSAGTALADHLRALGYGVTEFAARGREGAVQVIYTVLPRREITRVLDEVESHDRSAFITVEQPREIRWGWMPTSLRPRILPTLPFDWARRTQLRPGRNEEK
ncbi:MAG TPA: DUF5698 domain-containing protein [Longimicrobiales bacterium]|nr:DUF5698 domain-containing protein [Longimicrobiales bacterium]